jgi:hypothetical protein
MNELWRNGIKKEIRKLCQVCQIIEMDNRDDREQHYYGEYDARLRRVRHVKPKAYEVMQGEESRRIPEITRPLVYAME